MSDVGLNKLVLPALLLCPCGKRPWFALHICIASAGFNVTWNLPCLCVLLTLKISNKKMAFGLWQILVSSVVVDCASLPCYQSCAPWPYLYCSSAFEAQIVPIAPSSIDVFPPVMGQLFQSPFNNNVDGVIDEGPLNPSPTRICKGGK